MFIKMHGIKRLIQCCVFLSTLALCLNVLANEQFPIKPISMTIPFPPGGVATVN